VTAAPASWRRRVRDVVVYAGLLAALAGGGLMASGHGRAGLIVDLVTLAAVVPATVSAVRDVRHGEKTLQSGDRLQL
jgi:hypothetical protein